MPHDVFVSYASEDKATADAVVEALEQRKIRCWVAPRDVGAGRDYAEALVQAIDASRVLVLVFSSNANASPHVMREISRAADRGNPILPLRIEDVPFSKTMEYYISTTHWLDALTSPLDQYLDQLVQSVAALLGVELVPLPAAVPPEDEAELDTAPPAARDEPAPTPAIGRSEPARAPVPTAPQAATQGGSGPPPAQRLLTLARDWRRRPAVLLAAGATALAAVGVAIALVMLAGGGGDSQPLVAAQPSATPRPASTARPTSTPLPTEAPLPTLTRVPFEQSSAYNDHDQAIMVLVSSGFESADDLATATICVLEGTTWELSLANRLPNATALALIANDEIEDAFVEERCAGWMSDATDRLEDHRIDLAFSLEVPPEALRIIPLNCSNRRCE